MYTMTDYEHDIVHDVRLGEGLVYYNIEYKGLPVEEINFFFHNYSLITYVMRNKFKKLNDAEKLEMEWLDNFAVTYKELRKDAAGFPLYQLRDAQDKFAGVMHVVHKGKTYTVEYINWDENDATATLEFKDYLE